MVVKTTRNTALAAEHSIDPDRWWEGFGALIDRIAPVFRRYEPVRHAGALMLGLLSGLDRKNCWTIAERRGDESPNKLQTYSPGRSGTPTRFGTSYAAMCKTPSTTRRESWLSTRPAI